MALTVTDSSAATNTKTRLGYVVIDSAPSASFTKDKTSGNAPLTVAFDASGSTGTNLVYAWNFGDPGSGSANTSNLQKPSHTFSTANTFTVSLTVSNAAGTSAPTTQQITATTASGSTTTLTPDADAQVKSSSATTNYGSLNQLQSREDPAATGPITYRDYLRFNVPVLSGTVTSVKLRLFVTTASALTQTVFNTTSQPNWIETGPNGGTAINWSNAPTIGSTVLGTSTATPAGAYREFTLTLSSVTSNTAVTFAIKNSGTTSAIFSSKEAAANPPQLVIVTGP